MVLKRFIYTYLADRKVRKGKREEKINNDFNRRKANNANTYVCLCVLISFVLNHSHRCVHSTRFSGVYQLKIEIKHQ